jgi:tellurite resistance protein TehA-like permease
MVTMNAARVPLNFFAMPFGLAGLGVTWLTMAGYGRVPPAVGDIVLPRLLPANRRGWPDRLGRGRRCRPAPPRGGHAGARHDLSFMPSTWAFTFSWAAVATTVTYCRKEPVMISPRQA